MKKPQDVRVWEVKERPKNARTKRPHIVRWVVEGREFSSAKATKEEARDLHARLFTAMRDGETFDVVRGLPASWTATPAPTVVTWARQWVSDEWDTWQPRTRSSVLEALAHWLPLLVDERATARPDGMKKYLTVTLAPGGEASDVVCERWVDRWSLPLDAITKLQVSLADQVATERADGAGRVSEVTARRRRTTMKACIERAVELELISRSPWPQQSKGRTRRKVIRESDDRAVKVDLLPSIETMERIIAAMQTHQPASEMYSVMATTMWLAGLRPSECVDLRVEACTLPEQGRGSLLIDMADVGNVEPGKPKTGVRTVSIPAKLVEVLRAWVDSQGLSSGFLFRTAKGSRPTNLLRSLHAACDKVGFPHMRVYDLRHTCATMLLNSGIKPGDAAARLGHSVEVLMSTYAGVLEYDEEAANARIDEALAGVSLDSLVVALSEKRS